MGKLYEGEYECMKAMQQEYEDLEVELKDKEDILAEARREADAIRRRCKGYRRRIKIYSDAIQQAWLGLEAAGTEESIHAHQSRRSKGGSPAAGCRPPGQRMQER